MKITLKSLLPLHEARERRALRQFQQDRQAHGAALTEQVRAAKLMYEKAHAYDRMRSSVLAKDMSAAEAQANMSYASLLANYIKHSEKYLSEKTAATEKALETAKSSRTQYLKRMRTNQLVQHASDRQEHQRVQALMQVEEQRNEEDFASIWLAKRDSTSGARK